MKVWRTAPKCQKISICVILVGAIGLLSLIIFAAFKDRSDVDLLIALLFAAAAAAASVWVMADRWAARYDEAFEIGYRVRDLDERLPAQRERHLQVVDLPQD